MLDHIRLAISVLIVLLFLTSLIGCASKKSRSAKVPSPPKKPTHLEMPKVKPPIGLMPKFVWDHQRVLMIDAAMDRYKADGKEIPIEWIEEIESLLGIIRTKELRTSEECVIQNDSTSEESAALKNV